MYVFITKKYEPNYFLKSHIGRMIGSYITALTAFIVVNDIPYIPSIIKWIGPSIILIPLIFIWQKKYIKSN
jgi:Na+/phosphate symporter